MFNITKFEVYVQAAANSKWDIKEFGAENSYISKFHIIHNISFIILIDDLLKEIRAFSVRLNDKDLCLTPHMLKTLWEAMLSVICDALVEGYSRVKKVLFNSNCNYNNHLVYK